MKKLFELVGVIRVDGLENAYKHVSDFEKSVKKSLAPIERYGKQLEGIGKNLSKTLTLPLALAGGAVLKFGGDFEDAMTNSLSIMGNVSEGMRSQMEGIAMQMSERLPYSAKQAADAYFFLASAGKTATQTMALMPKVAEFATAGNFALENATSLLMDSQSALGLSTKDVVKDQENLVRISDVLVKANILANGSVEDFATSLTNKAGSALRLVNKDVEEGVAVLAAYAMQGVKGEKAGEQLSIILRDLQTSALENAEAFKSAGIQVYDSSGKMNNLGDIIGDLEGRFEGMSDKQKRSELTLLGFQDRSVSAILTLMGTSNAIKDYEAELRKAGGTTEEVSGKQMESFNKQVEVMKNKVVNVAISFSKSLIPVMKDQVIPFFESMVDKVKAAVTWFTDLPEGIQGTILGFTAFVAVAGPALIVIGKLISSVKIITAVVTSAKLAMLAFNSTLMATPTGLLVAGIAAITIGIYKLSTTTDQFANQFAKIKDTAMEQKAEFDVLSQRLIILSENQNKSTQAHKDYEKAIDDLKSKYPGYFSDLDKEKTKHTELLDILEKQRKAFYAKLVMQMREKEIQVFVEKQIQLQKELNRVKDLELIQAAQIRITEKELEPLKEQANISIKREIAARQKLREEYDNSTGSLDEHQKGIRASLSDMQLQENIVYDNQEAFKKLDDQKEAHFQTNQQLEALQKEINSLSAAENKLTSEYNNLLAGSVEAKKENNALSEKEVTIIQNANKATLEQIEAAKKLKEEKDVFISGYQDKMEQLALTEMEQLDLEEMRAMESAENLKLSEEEKAEIQAYYAMERYNLQVEFDAQILEQAQAKYDEEQRIADEAEQKRLDQIEREKAAEKAKWDAIKSFTVGAISMISDIYSIYTNNKIAKIDKDLEKQKTAIEASKLSEEEKQKKFEELDAKAAKKKKALQIQQAKGDKAQAIVNATNSTWEAAVKALTAGPFLGPIMAGIITALGLAKVAMIAAQPLPQLAEGALIKQSQGGTPVIVGEGADDETVLPMRKGAWEIADRIMDNLSEFVSPGSQQPAFAMGGGGAGIGGGSGMRPVEHHWHIGTLVADREGLKRLERTLYQFRAGENTRRGE